jgi:hypothetical protein
MRSINEVKALLRHAGIDTDPNRDKAVLADAICAGGLTPDPLSWRCQCLMRIAIPVSAIAACLAAIPLGWWVLSNRAIRPAVSSHAVMTIETAGGTTIKPGTALLTQAGQIARFTLNGKHTLAMNARTRLSVRPFTEADRTGCLIDLASGEVYIHVEHDGDPFVVQTPHGRAVITGTTFDVTATDASTTLVVVEGSVRFESQRDAVQVTPGRESMVFAASEVPTSPMPCDVAVLTAWARPLRSTIELAPKVDALNPDDLPLPASPNVRTDLHGIEYTQWVEQNRDWFKRQFPDIFRLKTALAEEGVEADYPDLLLKSGIVWQFAWPPAAPDRLLAPDEATIIRVANRYGKDLQWLRIRNLAHGEVNATQGQFVGKEAFSRWQREVSAILDNSQEIPGKLLLGSLHAGDYLRRTRSLVWLAVETDRYSLPKLSKAEVLALVQTKITAADTGVNAVIQLLVADRALLPCASDPYRQLVREVSESLTQMAQTEEIPADETANRHP